MKEKCLPILGLLGVAIRFFVNRLGAILLISLPIILPLTILESLVQFNPFIQNSLIYRGMFALTALLVSALYLGALITMISSEYNGEKWTISSCYRNAYERWKNLFLVILVVDLAMRVGIVLLVVPGLIISARCFTATMFVALEHKGPIEALRASNGVMKPYTLALVLLLGVVTAFVIALYFGGAGRLIHANLFTSIIAIILFPVISTIVVIFQFYFYQASKEVR
jgi:hypothetical protein